ncbi:hypothetical protein KP79_PYT05052 [Mizuhopecten yessoensis]|uniref:Uncharacterized protein n=1 Tax=Mizuhopecten yessoensis TaxID=6573 RepID=A0A210QKF6_MIZYE|nr:hypothetical protein KP79_PYT05052 [Mizuhopecten yessoensis]
MYCCQLTPTYVCFITDGPKYVLSRIGDSYVSNLQWKPHKCSLSALYTCQYSGYSTQFPRCTGCIIKTFNNRKIQLISICYISPAGSTFSQRNGDRNAAIVTMGALLSSGD